MSSGPGTTGKSPLHAEEAIEEISGLLEIDDGLSSTGSKKGDGHDAVDVSMETPPPVTPGPFAKSSGEHSSEPAANMAYEDLLEKLVLPGAETPSGQAEAEDAPFPPIDTPQPTKETATEDAPWRFPAGPSLLDSAEERTVVTQNPLLAEEQEAAREAAAAQTPTAISDPSYQAAASAYTQAASSAETAQVSYASPSVYNNTPVVVPVGPAPIPLQPRPAPPAATAGRIQISYPMFGGVVLTALIVGGLVVRYLAPSPHVAPVQTEVVVAPTPVQPAAPAPVAQPTPAPQAATPTPAPEVVPVPTPVAATAAVPEAKPTVPEPAAEPAAETKPSEEAAPEPRPAPKPKAHHAAKPASKPSPKPAPAAKPAPASKPAKPAGKPAGKKGGWTDPFDQ